jgi:hypothetical protein
MRLLRPARSAASVQDVQLGHAAAGAAVAHMEGVDHNGQPVAGAATASLAGLARGAPIDQAVREGDILAKKDHGAPVVLERAVLVQEVQGVL